ncbi:MAG: tRNA (guanosine(46)-N7)-methyltransferase TrmB [Verrucomicrobia bacterium]|nr:MAG: tRNA (guanosine(46)-N7)-methyltransferase TrmB [Verrucomicrobiota bacterium]
MHQKQPPATIAALVAGGGELWARLGPARSATRAALKSRATAGILFILADLRQCRSPFVPLFLDLLRRSLLSFLLSMPAREVQSAHRPESFRGSPLIEVDSLIDRLDLEKIFARRAALHVDLGCGNGSFLCALAQRIPEKNFLGIERLLGRIRSATRKAAKIGNVRLLRMESSYVVRYLLPTRSVETFYLLFPDPWPKRRHWRRRLVTEDFLSAISQALVENGTFRIATDQREYFEKMKEMARANSNFAIIDPSVADLPLTKFERTFRAQGASIHWLELRKVSPVR